MGVCVLAGWWAGGSRGMDGIDTLGFEASMVALWDKGRQRSP